MKIGFDAKRLFNNKTGLGNYSRSLINNLLRFGSGSDLYLYASKTTIPEGGDLFWKHPHAHLRVQPHVFPAYQRMYGIRQYLKKDEIDIFHGLSHEIPYQLKGLERGNIRSVVSIHDVMYKVLPQTYGLIDRWIYDIKFNHCLKNSDKIVAISQHTKRDIMRFFSVPEEKIEVIYNIGTDFFIEKGCQENELVHRFIKKKYELPSEFIFCVGTIEERKNLEVLLHSYLLLKKEFRLPIVILGSPTAYKKKLLHIIQKNNLQELVIWVENITDIEVLLAFYQQASLLVYPSKYEGFGLPILEALLCKLPVISSSVSALPEAGGPDSIYIKPNDEKDLAMQIERVLQDSNLQKKMRDSGFSYATQHFHPTKIIRQWMYLYENLLK